MEFAVGEVDERTVGIEGVAIAEHLQARAGRQRRGVDLGDVQARDQSVETVLTLLVGHRVRAVLEVDAHARHAGLLGILHPVAVAVGEHLADQVRLGVEHAADDLHGRAGAVGSQAAAHRLRAVDAAAALRADAEAHAVAERGLCALRQNAQRELQRRAGAACRIGQRRAVQPRAATHVREARRQQVVHQRARQRAGRGVVDLDGVVDEIANLGSDPVGALLDEQAAGGGPVERHVEAHRLALRTGDDEAVAV